MAIKSADRASEFNRLLVEQGFITRSMKYGYRPDEAEQEKITQRGARLVELAELMDLGQEEGPERYVNERIAAWLRGNQLALTNDRLAEFLLEHIRPDRHVTCNVLIQIGDTSKGYAYTVLADDVAYANDRRLVFTIPDSVAEHFRQQGRRALQREHANLLGYKLDF